MEEDNKVLTDQEQNKPSEPGEDTKDTDKVKNQAEEKKYTDADLDRIIDRKFAKWKSEKQKEVDEAKRLTEMDAQQKAEYQRDQLQKQLDELKHANAKNEMTGTARNMLSESGIHAQDELLSCLVTDNAESTKAAIDSFTKLFNAAVESAVTERLKSPTPKMGGKSRMTKEQIFKIKDKSTRLKAIQDNIDLFN
jgi:small-conductance mechanosensitive channel